MAWAAARCGGDCVNGLIKVFDMHEPRRSDPDGRTTSAEHIGELTVAAIVLVNEIR